MCLIWPQGSSWLDREVQFGSRSFMGRLVRWRARVRAGGSLRKKKKGGNWARVPIFHVPGPAEARPPVWSTLRLPCLRSIKSFRLSFYFLIRKGSQEKHLWLAMQVLGEGSVGVTHIPRPPHHTQQHNDHHCLPEDFSCAPGGWHRQLAHCTQPTGSASQRHTQQIPTAHIPRCRTI